MLGYYDGYSNGAARPVTHDDWKALHCKDCGVTQTHHREDGTKWRCVICNTIKNGGTA